ncbi:enoyl-CoA hydratase/isomerase family protein [Amycolatopsis sp. A1MSW2902]|uniref:enoyl-CoA hydratase/isomerase family protein n=1 Tax=Amycolatopsis sp. A1MSW2902 TaxID=687413 RepID=UPI00307DBDCD
MTATRAGSTRTVSGTDSAYSVADGVAVVEFGGSGRNTFPTEKMERLTVLVGEAAEDSRVRALVFGAGEGRSFGVGGDFNEVGTFTGGREVARWINACVDLYRSVLAFPKPTVAAVEKYCIGIGLQLALCADWRLATARADLRMPELKLGISCILGAPLLYERVSAHVANRMIIGCGSWSAGQALADGLVDEIAAGPLLPTSVRLAGEFGEYQQVPVSRTKAFVNNRLIMRLEEARIAAIEGHRAGFAASSAAQEKMRSIVAGRDA